MTVMRPQEHGSGERFLLIGAVIFVVIVLAVLGYLALTLKAQTERLTAELSSERAAEAAKEASSSAALLKASTTIAALASQLSLTSDQLNDLEDNYTAEKQKNDNFQNQINKITSTVSDLDKLSKTDKELLQKYSKVYFLNENYVPSSLTDIPKTYLYDETLEKKIHTKVLPYLTRMQDAAKDDGIDLWVVSAYRSFTEQSSLKNSYTMVYGSGANAFSADQGYSEHQLGTTVDFTTKGLNGGLDGFGQSDAYAWLQKNAYRYGFIISYPANNGYYEFEPWHWRFVGVDLAGDLHRQGKYFYDLDQRTIDTYLINIFD